MTALLPAHGQLIKVQTTPELTWKGLIVPKHALSTLLYEG